MYGRFAKKYPSAGTSIWAIHTRDYRINNPYGCQILVTVPEMLQILLLSPRVSKAWAPRLRRIIFDEVHSIGNLDGGVVWEQCIMIWDSLIIVLLTTTVPLIALSATVGNAREFHEVPILLHRLMAVAFVYSTISWRQVSFGGSPVSVLASPEIRVLTE